MRFALIFLGLLPLSIIHILGNILGDILYFTSPKIREKTINNLNRSGIISDYKKINSVTRKITHETTKTSLELAIALTRSPKYISSLFKKIEGLKYLEQAIEQKQGILFMTPHLGSFDLAGRYLSEIIPSPTTALFKPAKLTWLTTLMKRGRERGNVKVAEANKNGVRKIYKALKNNESVVLLPDQVPETGEGIMSTFFNQPAYTMTLAAKLAHQPNVIPLFFIGERLSAAKGFILHIYPLNEKLTNDVRRNVQLINNQIEILIKLFPNQYLFSYNRYKIPAGCENK